jgi:DNA-binding transcriptional LysR family regulator
MQTKARALLGRLSDVDLRLLRVFKAVADCGGMAAAELELNISVSTISRHIKDLEERLGLVLCRRGRGGFALSTEGVKIYAATEQLLLATESFRSKLHELHRGAGGELHVALFEKTASNPDARVAEAVGIFRDEAPAVSLNLHVGTITMIEQGVMSGQFHLGIIPEHRPSDSLDYTGLFEERMSLYAGRSHPWFQARRVLGWEALRNEPLAALGYHSPNMVLAHQHQLDRSATASDQEGVATLILSGRFVGFLPDHYAEPFVRMGRMRSIGSQTLNYRCKFSCISRKAQPLPRAAEAFRQALIMTHQVAA